MDEKNQNIPPELSVTLTLQDHDVVKYLSKYEGKRREEKALEALKIGVVAILSASPSLDTKIVEEKFNELDSKLREYAESFKKELGDDLRKYFEKEKGDIPATLNSFFGERGLLAEALKDYFDKKTGRISLLLQEELGPGSSFFKSLDPENKESVISRIEALVSQKLSETAQGVIGQFSLDKDDSGMSRIKKLIEDKVGEIKSTNEDFFSELRQHLNIQKAVADEAEKGTQKGRDFETALYERVAILGQQLQDVTENVTGVIGEIPRSKVGDYIVILGETSGAPGRRIVIEAKMGQSYRMKDAMTELQEAKENRKADCGIFVFAKGYEPIEMGDFKIDGNDFYCAVDEATLIGGGALLFFESAYKISRVQIVTRARKELSGGVNLIKIRDNVAFMIKQTELMAELITKAKTIKNHGESIEDTLKSIKENLDLQLQATLELLKQ